VRTHILRPSRDVIVLSSAPEPTSETDRRARVRLEPQCHGVPGARSLGGGVPELPLGAGRAVEGEPRRFIQLWIVSSIRPPAGRERAAHARALDAGEHVYVRGGLTVRSHSQMIARRSLIGY
jgi:hypothetical protein